MTDKKLYFGPDEKIVVFFSISELGWHLQMLQGRMRQLKQTKYPDHKFICFCDLDRHVFHQDFVFTTIALPNFFYEAGLERDCFEAPPPESPPGALTDPVMYAKLIEYFRGFYDHTSENTVEIWPPRGCSQWAKNQIQLFCKYTTAPIPNERPVITIFPRGRARAANRNVPPSVWHGIVDSLKQTFTVVLAGTPEGACLGNYPKDQSVINLISDTPDTERIIQWLNTSVCSISSQSGGTHISLLSGCPSYIIGHERQRHCVDENRLNTPTTFRTVPGNSYMSISAEQVLDDVQTFLYNLQEAGMFEKLDRPALRNLQGQKDLVGVELGVFKAANAANILQFLDIKKLYLVDPFLSYAGKELDVKTSEEIEKTANLNLRQYPADKVEWIKKKSVDAVDDIPDDLDFCYLDSDHTYENVMVELELYYKKVKDGGVIGGHDYDKSSADNGVKRAVDSFFKEKGLEVHSKMCRDSGGHTIDWWVIKPTTYDKVLERDADILREMIDKSIG